MLALCVSGATSCSTDECFDNSNSLPLAGFYSSEEPLQAVEVDSLEIKGYDVPGDSLLTDGKRSISQTYLPFRIDQPSTTYIFRYTARRFAEIGLADTVTFRYDITPFFVSSACGAVYEYRDITIETTRHAIDSIVCPAGEITNQAIENIRIYFRTYPATD